MHLDSIYSKKQQYQKVNNFLKENFGIVIKEDIPISKIDKLIAVIQQSLSESRNLTQDSQYSKNLLLKEALKLLREVSPSTRRVKSKVVKESKKSMDTKESLTFAIASKAMSAYKSSGKMPKTVKIDDKDYPVKMSMAQIKKITGGKEEVTDSVQEALVSKKRAAELKKKGLDAHGKPLKKVKEEVTDSVQEALVSKKRAAELKKKGLDAHGKPLKVKEAIKPVAGSKKGRVSDKKQKELDQAEKADKQKTGSTPKSGPMKKMKESYEVTLKSEYKKQPTLETFQSLYEQDLEQAEVLLAAKDLVDKLQKMVEDTASMQVEELLPLVDAMKERMGPDKADGFNTSVDQGVPALLKNLKQAKDSVDNAVLALSGDAPMPDMSDDMEDAPAMDPDDIDAAMDDLEGVEQMSGGEEDTLGRIPKESSFKDAMKLILDNTSRGKVDRKILEQAKKIISKKKI